MLWVFQERRHASNDDLLSSPPVNAYKKIASNIGLTIGLLQLCPSKLGVQSISADHPKSLWIWMGLSSAIDRYNYLGIFIVYQRTSLRAMETLNTPMERKKVALYKVDGSIMVFQIFFYILIWIKVGVIFYYGYGGFGDRPKSASFSIFFDI